MLEELVVQAQAYAQKEQYREAYPLFLEAAMAGDAEATLQLGVLYLHGRGVPRNYEKAFHFFRAYYEWKQKLEPLAYIQFCDDIVVHGNRKGVAQYRAFLEYLIAQEEWQIYVVLSDEYDRGVVYPRDENEAIWCLRQALSHGVEAAADFLGEKYYLGQCVEQDYHKAYEFFTMFEEEETLTKPYYLALMYRDGIVVPQDAEKAKDYLTRIVDMDFPYKEMDQYYEMAIKLLAEMEDFS